MRTTAPVSAIILAYKRIEQTLVSIRKIKGCQPPPEEILIHVDGNQTACAEAIRKEFPSLCIICSQESVGPGGGRNKLIAVAKNEIIASFDDDSYPIDADYFFRVQRVMASFPEAAILSAAIFHQGEAIKTDAIVAAWATDFIGCGCIYRKTIFQQSAGYVPLSVAYCMEEVDLSLRYRANGRKIIATPWLRIYHDTQLSHHGQPHIVAGSIANLALLTFLRYPLPLWPLGILQCLNRIRYLIMRRNYHGILRGIAMIPWHCWSNRNYRKVIGADVVLSYLKHRSQPLVFTPIET